MSPSAPEILGFTGDHVCQLTGLSKAQLRYWDQTEFFSPTYVPGQRYYNRIYSFRDLVGLRVIAILRNERTVPLQELRKVGSFLKQVSDTPWSSLRLYLQGRQVYFADRSSGRAIVAAPGEQVGLELSLEPIAADVRTAAERLRERDKHELGKIERKPYVLHGAWCLAGTRIPTATIDRLHQAGYTSHQIIGEYPSLTQRDVTAAIEFERDRQKRAA
jgi:uncharacterized protein (DUF433 family)